VAVTPTIEQERVLIAAAEARFLLENPRLQAAFATLEQKYILGWRNSQASTPEQREKLYWLITALDEVRGELTREISGGRIVAEELRQLSVQDLSESQHGNGAHPGIV
jgi:hypothetical protein